MRFIVEENFPSRDGWSRELPVVIVVRAIGRRHPRVPWRRHARRHARVARRHALAAMLGCAEWRRYSDRGEGVPSSPNAHHNLLLGRNNLRVTTFRKFGKRTTALWRARRLGRAPVHSPGQTTLCVDVPVRMRSALILVFVLGSASAEKGYNRSRTKLAIPKYVGSPPADRRPTARIVGGAPP